MKTNQTMLLTFDSKTLAVEHKTQMGSLTDLWAIGNFIRRSKGLSELDMKNYLRSPETLELVQAVERKYGIESKCVESTHLKKGMVDTIQSPLIKTKRGRHGGGTWAHIYILLDAASRLDADFKVKIYDIFIEGKLLDWRDDSGDSFKELNLSLDAMVFKIVNKRPSSAFYQRVASYIKDRVKPTGGTWNTATPEELKLRTKIEERLITIIDLDLIKTESDIFRVINEMK
jgi:hypothetical protein